MTPQILQAPYNPYNSNNRLAAGGYDAAGNMGTVGALSFWYDAEGRQIQSYDAGSHTTAYYTYDADGQRVQKAVSNGLTTVYIHDAFEKLAAEYASSAPTPPCTTCYLSYDHLGSVRLITDQNANVISRHDYLPFGEEIPNGSGGRSGNGFDAFSNVNQMFTGQERDGEMVPNVDFFNARYFMGVLGNFTSPDPANAGADLYNPQSWNAYAYVLGNPLNGVDPSGMSLCPTSTPGSIVCVQNDPTPASGNPDFATSTLPYSFINDWISFLNYALMQLSGGGGGGGAVGGGRSAAPKTTPLSVPPNSGTCHSLAAGQAPSEGFLSWYMGVGNAMQMTSWWALGVGPTQTNFGPDSFASKEMMSAYGLSSNVKAFLAGGASSGNQNFGLGGLWSTGLNPTGQFVGSYQWSMSRSGGNLNITLTNSTTAWSGFYHPPFLNPNPPTRNGWRPMGRVNQTFQVTVPCS